MKTSLHRTLKAVCASAVLALLTACGGSSSVVDPLTVSASRVIGLGDGYNDVGFGGATTRFTVRDANNSVGSAVVEKLAPMFGGGSTGVAVTARQSLPSSGVYSYASGNSLVSSGTNSLQTQVTNLLSDVGGTFGSSDLIVIHTGAADLIAGRTANQISDGISAAVQRLVDSQAKYVMVVIPLYLDLTPGGGDNAKSSSLSSLLKTAIQNINAGLPRNSVLVVDMQGSGRFGAINANNLTFTDLPISSNAGLAPYCGHVLTGCADNGQSYTNVFFADDYHLTPAGYLWVAQQLYSAAGVAAWR